MRSTSRFRRSVWGRPQDLWGRPQDFWGRSEVDLKIFEICLRSTSRFLRSVWGRPQDFEIFLRSTSRFFRMVWGRPQDIKIPVWGRPQDIKITDLTLKTWYSSRLKVCTYLFQWFHIDISLHVSDPCKSCVVWFFFLTVLKFLPYDNFNFFNSFLLV